MLDVEGTMKRDKLIIDDKGIDAPDENIRPMGVIRLSRIKNVYGIHNTHSQIIAGVLPEVCSRYNSPSRAWSVSHLVKSARGSNLQIIAALSDSAHALATGLAIAKSCPVYSGKSKSKDTRVDVYMTAPNEFTTALETIHEAALGVQTAAELVDLPPNILTTTAFVARAHHVSIAHSRSALAAVAHHLYSQSIERIIIDEVPLTT